MDDVRRPDAATIVQVEQPDASVNVTASAALVVLVEQLAGLVTVRHPRMSEGMVAAGEEHGVPVTEHPEVPVVGPPEQVDEFAVKSNR